MDRMITRLGKQQGRLSRKSLAWNVMIMIIWDNVVWIDRLALLKMKGHGMVII